MIRSEIELDVAYHVSEFSDDVSRYQQAAQWVVQRVAAKRLWVSIAIVDDETIREQNRLHMQHDWATDVVSLAYTPGPPNIEGEIIASQETATRLAPSAGWSPTDELLLYVIHGLLHLAGLDDIEADDRRLMRRTEYQCLLDLKVPGAEEYLERFERITLGIQ